MRLALIALTLSMSAVHVVAGIFKPGVHDVTSGLGFSSTSSSSSSSASAPSSSAISSSSSASSSSSSSSSKSPRSSGDEAAATAMNRLDAISGALKSLAAVHEHGADAAKGFLDSVNSEESVKGAGAAVSTAAFGPGIKDRTAALAPKKGHEAPPAKGKRGAKSGKGGGASGARGASGASGAAAAEATTDHNIPKGQPLSQTALGSAKTFSVSVGEAGTGNGVSIVKTLRGGESRSALSSLDPAVIKQVAENRQKLLDVEYVRVRTRVCVCVRVCVCDSGMEGGCNGKVLVLRHTPSTPS